MVRRTAGAPRRAEVRIRPAEGADINRILEIGNAVFPDYRETPDEFLAGKDRLRAGGYASVHKVAEIGDGVIVGHCEFRHMPWQFRPSRYFLCVFTHPDWQGRGIGDAMYRTMLADLAGRGATEVESFARETMPAAVAFLQHRGFLETMRAWETRLDLTRFDSAPFTGYYDRARAAGVVITTLGDERRDDDQAARRAYELHNAVVADIPLPIPFTPPSFDDFMRTSVESPRAVPDAYFLAKIGGRYVGEANLERPVGGSHLHHDVTGVLPEYRGHGIAMALKLATIAYGQARGHSEIRTWNAVGNVAMLAINDRLGFVRQPAWITFEKTLSRAAV